MPGLQDKLERPRLLFLDGLRGIAVALVVLHHLYLRLFDPGGTGQMPFGLPRTALIGRLGVDAFIVLSGYSLMLPVARAGGGRLPGGLARYFRRRARRILPPYYAALAASLLPLVPALIGWPRLPWHHNVATAPVLSLGAFASHVLLLHNLRADWAFTINGPLWSLATEWQIYFAFAWLLLPLWRRTGALFTAAVATAVGIWLGRFAPQAAPWYLGLFSFGMASAGRSGAPRRKVWSATAVGCVAAAAMVGHWGPANLCLFDCVSGLAVMTVLVGQGSAGRTPFSILLNSRAAVGLGTVSYSLYLIHQPLIVLADTGVTAVCGLTGTARVVGIVVLSLPTLVIATRLFHRIIELPCMPGRPVTPTQAARSAALEPAV